VNPIRFQFAVLASLAALLTSAAEADIVTGTVSPEGAKVVILDSSGKEVARLGSGPYQLQLPVGKYTARCEAPKAREQALLSLSDPVTVNIACN
jgi:phosphate-selective porin